MKLEDLASYYANKNILDQATRDAFEWGAKWGYSQAVKELKENGKGVATAKTWAEWLQQQAEANEI